VVSQRAVSVGDIVAPGNALFTVIDPSTLRLEASVPADAIGAVSNGVAVRFSVQGMADASFEGTVERVAPAVDAVTRQLPILVSIPNEEGKLIAGLFAEGRIAAQLHDALLIPLDAVVEGAAAPTVLRVRDGVVEQVAVTLGVSDPDRELVEVLTGLAEGDQVILGAARDMAAGTPVEIRTEG
jgi:RND family efflux transporter MFP subunit